MGNEEAMTQILQSFQNLAPLLHDQSLKLAPNPGAAKRQRKHQDSNGPKSEEHSGQRHNQAKDTQQVLHLMAKLLVRVERDLQVLQRETTFIFYFKCTDQKGILPLLLQQADAWHKKAKEGSSSSTSPLRQVLLQTVLSTLSTRLNKLLEAPEDSPLLQAALQTQLLLENKTIPYMAWNPQERRLQISDKTPVSLAKMNEHCNELMEGFRDVSLIMKFHSLPTKEGSTVTPWRLQMSIREERTYELLQHLAHSQVWTLLAASLKQHNLHQSSLATSLEQSMGLRPAKGQSKGHQKGTKPSKMPPKQET